MNRVLVIDDEQIIREAIKKLLQRNHYEVDIAESVEQAEADFVLTDYHLLLVDIRLPGQAGTVLIKKAAPVPVLVMTSYASVRSAVDAMQQGAADYISKPFDHDELLLLIKRTIQQQQNKRAQQALKSDLAKSYPVAGMIGNCPGMQEIKKQIAKVAPTDASVLILGESGTGKELVARAVHEQSKRHNTAFVTVNCAAIPENLVESELFGHTKGAFTGADKARTGMIQAADNGTLFLDEIGELPLSAQARLLRVLQNGEMRPVGSEILHRVNIRLLVATNRNLKQMVQDKEFRSDLYFRLQVVEIQLPPLRERKSDLPKLIDHLLEKTCSQLNRATLGISAQAIACINNYDWPGNIRELENAIERAVILAEDNEITAELLAIEKSPASNNTVTEDLSLEAYFKQTVLSQQDQMTETALAKKLGISRKTLWERRQKLNIPRR